MDGAKEGVLTSSLVEVDWKLALGGRRAMACLACTPRTRSALLSCGSGEFFERDLLSQKRELRIGFDV